MLNRLKEIPDLWLVLFVLVFTLGLYVLIFAAWGVWEGMLRDLVLAAATAFFTLLKVRAEHGAQHGARAEAGPAS